MTTLVGVWACDEAGHKRLEHSKMSKTNHIFLLTIRASFTLLTCMVNCIELFTLDRNQTQGSDILLLFNSIQGGRLAELALVS